LVLNSEVHERGSQKGGVQPALLAYKQKRAGKGGKFFKRRTKTAVEQITGSGKSWERTGWGNRKGSKKKKGGRRSIQWWKKPVDGLFWELPDDTGEHAKLSKTKEPRGEKGGTMVLRLGIL